MTFYRKRTIEGEFDDIVDQVTESLQAEGFGVLCDIDVGEKFKEKLDLETYPNYRILGACNPPLAHDGLEAEPDLGVFLPCNIVVYETDSGDVVVSAVDPNTMLSVVENEALDAIAEEVDEAFKRVLDEVAT